MLVEQNNFVLFDGKILKSLGSYRNFTIQYVTKGKSTLALAEFENLREKLQFGRNASKMRDETIISSNSITVEMIRQNSREELASKAISMPYSVREKIDNILSGRR